MHNNLNESAYLKATTILLKNLRVKHSISQEELAAKLGYDHSSLSRWENSGKLKTEILIDFLTYYQIKKLSDFYKKLEDLIELYDLS